MQEFGGGVSRPCNTKNGSRFACNATAMWCDGLISTDYSGAGGHLYFDNHSAWLTAHLETIPLEKNGLYRTSGGR
jgi:hypothetical protein